MNQHLSLDNPNVAMLEMVVRELGEVCDRLVFVGGCATDLLVTEVRARQSRATEDVDVVTRATTIREYHQVESLLRAKKFQNDMSPNAPICRWVKGAFTVDVMPSGPNVLSFHNRWYPLAVETARQFQLPSKTPIRLIAAPVFVATKLEAFQGRGKGDFLISQDLEDIVTVVDGRPSLANEVRTSTQELSYYLKTELAALMKSPQFVAALPGYLPGDVNSQGRLDQLVERLEELAEH